MEFELFGMKFRVWVVALCILLGYFIGGTLLCSCSKVSIQEGMSMLADSDVSSLGKMKAVDSDLSALSKNTKGYSSVDANRLALFSENVQSPECCPSIYSGSDGCVCMTEQQAEYLNSRGGNRICPSEF